MPESADLFDELVEKCINARQKVLEAGLPPKNMEEYQKALQELHETIQSEAWSRYLAKKSKDIPVEE